MDPDNFANRDCSGHASHRSLSPPSGVSKGRVSRRASKRTTGWRPAAGFRQRLPETSYSEGFGAPELWHEPVGRSDIKFVVEPAGEGYLHPGDDRRSGRANRATSQAIPHQARNCAVQSNDAETSPLSLLRHAMGHGRVPLSDRGLAGRTLRASASARTTHRGSDVRRTMAARWDRGWNLVLDGRLDPRLLSQQRADPRNRAHRRRPQRRLRRSRTLRELVRSRIRLSRSRGRRSVPMPYAVFAAVEPIRLQVGNPCSCRMRRTSCTTS